MKIVVTGAGGQLGREIACVFRQFGDVIALQRHDLDVADGPAVRRVWRTICPDWVIHAAALTHVDYCEEAPDEALRINAVGTRNVAVATEAIGGVLLYISTDYVFSGEKGAAYDEFDPPDPIQMYGRSKWLGEESVRNHCPQHYIVRTSWLYGHGSERNFVAAIRRASAGKSRIAVVADQYGGPTYTRDLARALPVLIESELYGTYHVVNAGEVSRAEWARRILRALSLPVEVDEVSSETLRSPARRPRRTTLEPRHWRLSGFAELPPWEEAFERFVAAQRDLR